MTHFSLVKADSPPAARAGGDLWESWTEAKAKSSAVHPALIAAATCQLSEVDYDGTELVGNSLAEFFGWTEDTSQGGSRNRPKRGWGFVNFDGTPWGGYIWDGKTLDSEGKPAHEKEEPDGTTKIVPPQKRQGKGNMASRLFRPALPPEIYAKIAARNKVELPPVADFWNWVMDDHRVPVIPTESALKAMCLLSHGWIAVGVNGCWGAKVAPRVDPEYPEGRLDWDFAALAHGGREIRLALDSDWDTSPTVWNAVKQTGALLQHAGAKVYVCRWEPAMGKGVDDLIAAHGEEAFERALRDSDSERGGGAIPFGDWYRNCPKPQPKGEAGLGEAVSRALDITLEATDLIPNGWLIDEHASATGISPVGIIGALLPAVGSLIPNTWALEFGNGDGYGFLRGPTLWTVIVADSGQKKTPSIKAAIAPLLRLQHEAIEDYAIRQRHHKEEVARFTAQQKKGRDSGVMEPPPDAPDLRVYLFSEGTLEGIQQSASAPPNRRGFLCHRDELAGWAQGFNQYSRGCERQQWLQLAEQETTIRTIKSEATRCLVQPNICLTGGIQPAVLEKLRGNDDDGLWARFLLFRLPQAKYTPPGASQAAKPLAEMLEHTYRALDKLPTAPARFTVSEQTNPEGYQLFNEAFERWHNMAAAGSRTASLYSKASGRCGTVALILHCLECVANGESPLNHPVVATATIARAIAIVKYSLAQAVAQSVESDGEVSQENDEAMGLAATLSRKAWQLGREGWVSPRDLQQARKSLGSKGAKAVLVALAEAGKGEIMSTARSCRWRITPADLG